MTDEEISNRLSECALGDDCGAFAAETIFGDWRITAFIAKGGTAEVYCAEHVVLGTPAAVKVLSEPLTDSRKARFLREAKLLAELKSAAFSAFLGYGEANGRPYIAEELLEPGELPMGDRSRAKYFDMTTWVNGGNDGMGGDGGEGGFGGVGGEGGVGGNGGNGGGCLILSCLGTLCIGPNGRIDISQTGREEGKNGSVGQPGLSGYAGCAGEKGEYGGCIGGNGGNGGAGGDGGQGALAGKAGMVDMEPPVRLNYLGLLLFRLVVILLLTTEMVMRMDLVLDE